LPNTVKNGILTDWLMDVLDSVLRKSLPASD
jgi:hypothetical protein